MSKTEDRKQEASEDPVVAGAPMRLCPPGAIYLREAMASGESEKYELDVPRAGASILVGVRDKSVDDFHKGHRFYRVTPQDLMRAAVDHYEAEGCPEPEELDND